MTGRVQWCDEFYAVQSAQKRILLHMPFEVPKKESYRTRVKPRRTDLPPIAHTPHPSYEHPDSPLGEIPCLALDRAGGRESVPSVFALFRGGIPIFLVDGGATGSTEIRDPIARSEISSGTMPSTVQRRRGEAGRVFLAAISHFVFLIHSSNVAPKSRM